MKVKSNIARQKNTNKFNLSKQTITTTDYGIKRPIMCNIMFPGDKFVINVDHLTRLMPMPNPTFGKIKEIIRCFTVPYRTIHKHFNDMLANNNIYQDGAKLAAAGHWVYYGDLLYFVYNSSTICTESTENDYDVAISEYSVDDVETEILNTEVKYYKYTQKGRHIIAMLQGLGYNLMSIKPNADLNGDTEWKAHAENFSRSVSNTLIMKINIYPLIAFWKSYIDWCIPSRFLNDVNEIEKAIGYFYRNNGASSNLVAEYADVLTWLEAMLNTCPITYNSEDLYFTRAFLNPYGNEQDMGKLIVEGGLETQAGVIEPVSVNNHAEEDGAETPKDGGARIPINASDQILNVASLRTMGALQDMINRGKLNGTRVKDYLKSTYGIEPSLSELDYSEYLGKRENTIMIGDVISNADTKSENGGAYLGEYAGRAIGSGQNEAYTIEAKEHQLVIITHELCVENSYMQGLTPETWLIDKMDYFQPEMDAVDMQPIRYRELYASELVNRENPILSKEININGIWGWIERYAHFKKNTDTLSGDFRRHSVNEGMESWFMARKFELAQYGYLEWLRGINADFVKQYSETSSENYDKIFMYQGSDVDHFYCIFNLQIDAYRYMRSLETPFEFEEDETRTMENNFQGNIN